MFKFLIVGLLSGWLCSVHGLPKVSMTSANLAKVMLKSSYSMEDNPALTANCFRLYSPKLMDLTEQYQESYNGCLNNTAEEEIILDDQLQEDIKTIRQTSESINYHFENCSSITNSPHDLFECYNIAAGFTIQKANDVQNLSKNKMKYVEITEEYISYNQTLCTDECYRVYNEESMKVHTDLGNCLNGIYVATSSTLNPVSASTTSKPITTHSHETTTKKISTSEKPAVTEKQTTILVTTTKQPETTTEKTETVPVETKKIISNLF